MCVSGQILFAMLPRHFGQLAKTRQPLEDQSLRAAKYCGTARPAIRWGCVAYSITMLQLGSNISALSAARWQ